MCLYLSDRLPLRPVVVGVSIAMGLMLMAAGTRAEWPIGPAVGGPRIDSEDSALASIYDIMAAVPRPEGEFWSHLSFVGRLQSDLVAFSSAQGSLTGHSWRRSRAGFTFDGLENWQIVTEADFLLDDGMRFNQLADGYIRWQRDPWLYVAFGRQRPKFTLEGSISSKLLVTTERGNLAHNLWETVGFQTGLRMGGDWSRWSYQAAVFASEREVWFGDLDDGYFTVWSLGRDISGFIDLDEAVIRLDYVGDRTTGSGRDRPGFDRMGSVVTQWRQGRWALWTDLSSGQARSGQPDLVGWQIMPMYDLGERTQIVLRYTGLTSDGDNGIGLTRYESQLEPGRGDRYHDWYAGLNWYLKGHQLKWQAGLQYSTMSDAAGDGGDYEGWGFTSGLRISW